MSLGSYAEQVAKNAAEADKIAKKLMEDIKQESGMTTLLAGIQSRYLGKVVRFNSTGHVGRVKEVLPEGDGLMFWVEKVGVINVRWHDMIEVISE